MVRVLKWHGAHPGGAEASQGFYGGALRLNAWLEALLVLLAAAGFITLATWPWAAHLGSALCTHWDVGLHAWKLNWNASHILGGGFLLPDYNANFYYPQSYTLALDDLFWFPSYLAALVLFLSHNPILAYNLTFLFFWALNAVGMFLLLRELELGRPAAWLGALAFGVSPYLVSYYLEFNGVLCFGLPLVMWLLLRYLKRPTWLHALWLGLAFWAQAVSALYYTVILALSLPLVIAPLLREKAELLRSPRFWLLGLTGLVGVALLCLLYLRPYILLHNQLGLSRGLDEMARHSADAFSYLRNRSDFVVHTGLPWPGLYLPAIKPEVILWPGLVVSFLAAMHWWRSRRVLRPGGGAGGNLLTGLHWARVAALAVFWFWMGLALLTTGRFLGGAPGRLLINLSILCVLCTSLLISMLQDAGGLAGRFVAGLATAAFLCFFISLGPHIRVGGHPVLANNWLVVILAKLEVLKTTRVLSRYGILVLFALSVVGAMAFDRLHLGPYLRYGLLAAALVLIGLEAHIPISRPYQKLAHYPDKHLEEFLRSQEPCTMVVLPLGERALNSIYMLELAGDRSHRYLVNGWTGFNHPYGLRLSNLFSRGDWAGGCRELDHLWPEPLLVVDRDMLRRYVHRRGYRTSEKILRRHLPVLYQDEYFAVFRPHAGNEAGPRYERWVRSDLLRHARRIHFQARCPEAEKRVPFALSVNKSMKAHVMLGAQWQSYDIKLSDCDPSILCNAVTLASPAKRPLPVEVKEFCLVLR